MSEIPQAWSEVYDLVSDYLDSAILAGGALRDWDNGRPVKDLDFFYAENDRHGLLELIPQLRATHYIDEHRKLFSQADEDNSWDKGVLSVLYFPSTDVTLPDLNLISVPDPSVEVQLARFDFGICRIGYDGKLHKTDGYLMDQELRAFTILAERDAEQMRRSYERFERIRERYRGWRLLDPAKLAREFAGAQEPPEPKMEPFEAAWPPALVGPGGGGGGGGASGGNGQGGSMLIKYPLKNGTTIVYTIGAGGAGGGSYNR